MKKNIALLLLFACSSFVYGQQTFPPVTGETLSNKKVTLPVSGASKMMVVGMAFSPKADKSLKEWAQPLYNALIADAMGGMMGGNMYNADVRFVGMLRGIAKLALGEMKQRSREKIDKRLHDYFIISEQDVNSFCSELNITDKNEPHFFVLDANGTIRYHTSGEYSEKKLEEITGSLLQ